MPVGEQTSGGRGGGVGHTVSTRFTFRYPHMHTNAINTHLQMQRIIMTTKKTNTVLSSKTVATTELHPFNFIIKVNLHSSNSAKTKSNINLINTQLSFSHSTFSFSMFLLTMCN